MLLAASQGENILNAEIEQIAWRASFVAWHVYWKVLLDMKVSK